MCAMSTTSNDLVYCVLELGVTEIVKLVHVRVPLTAQCDDKLNRACHVGVCRLRHRLEARPHVYPPDSLCWDGLSTQSSSHSSSITRRRLPSTDGRD